jgi:preprotein translocase subunit YajC
MFFSNAYAQTVSGAAGGTDSTTALIMQFLPIVAIGLILYFLILRPQQRRVKEQQAMLAAIKKSDTVVTTGGIIAKVKSVQDDELRIEIAPNVDVRIERSAVAYVRNRTDAAPANDTKPAKTGD